ncbi:MAG: L-asparaginase 1, partial [Firmicutes bacterium]|nr:L-asparaginase 1 [Bacillota bacterium]
KTHSKNYNAFSSVNYPKLAAIRDGQLFSYIEPAVNYRWPIFCHELSQRVSVIKLTPGASAELLECYLRLNDAVIIESYGTGGIPQGTGQNFSEVIDRYSREGKVIVMTTQVANDGSDMSVYKVGGEIKNRYNLLEAYDMTTEAAVTKLMWVLGQTGDPNEVREMFSCSYAGEMSGRIEESR